MTPEPTLIFHLSCSLLGVSGHRQKQLHPSGADMLMVWQIPPCFTSCLVRAGESSIASSFHTTYVLLLGPLPALLARRHYYSCYQLFLSVSFGPADENKKDKKQLHCAELLCYHCIQKRSKGTGQSPPLQQEYHVKRWEGNPKYAVWKTPKQVQYPSIQ